VLTCSILVSTGKAADGDWGVWPYLAIIFALPVVSTGIYFFSIFYFNLREKERKCDEKKLPV